MNNNRVVAYLLIGVGVIFLLANINLGVGWLWIGLVALGFLAGYARMKSYGLLVTGSVLAGLAVGLLIGTWPGLMISLGFGFLAIDRVEPRSNRWPAVTAAVFAGLGVLGWLLDSGFFGSILFALVLIGAGLYLLTRRQDPKARERSDSFESVAPPPAAGRSEVSPVPAPTPQPRTSVGPTNPVPTAGEAVAPEAPERAVPTEARPEDALAMDEALLERLTAWRSRTAKEQDVSPFIVLPNETLEQIAREKPVSLNELDAIKGIGPAKRERYGEALLNLVRGSSA